MRASRALWKPGAFSAATRPPRRAPEAVRTAIRNGCDSSRSGQPRPVTSTKCGATIVRGGDALGAQVIQTRKSARCSAGAFYAFDFEVKIGRRKPPRDLAPRAGLAPAVTHDPAPEAARRLSFLDHNMSPVGPTAALADGGTLTLIDMVSKRLTIPDAPLTLDGNALQQAFQAHWTPNDEALGEIAFHLDLRIEDVGLLHSFGDDSAAQRMG